MKKQSVQHQQNYIFHYLWFSIIHFFLSYSVFSIENRSLSLGSRVSVLIYWRFDSGSSNKCTDSDSLR